MKKYISIPLFLFFCWGVFFSCEDDSFTGKSSYKISFSTDTLSFDTVFSTVLTPVRALMVYNKTSENLKIESIQLQSGNNCFQINVSGKSGTSFQDVKLYANDSLYIFVQVLVNELGQNAPVLIRDSIIFRYNGNVQKVILETNGQDVHLLRNEKITEDQHWTNDKPYLIYDSLTVGKEAKLRIDAGTKVYFHNSGTMVVDGKLDVQGDVENPVVFRGSRSDLSYNDISYDKLSNQWGGIRLTKESTGNVINHAVIRNGNFGIWIDSAEIQPYQYRLVLSNSEINNTKQATLKATSANVYVYNTVISNGAFACVLLEGGKYLFNQCTIADYTYDSRSFNSLILLNHIQFDENKIIPLEANFNNCIVYGTFQKELQLDNIHGSNISGADFNYLFRSCLIRYQQNVNNPDLDTYSSGFRNVMWNEDPGFQIDYDTYSYNFHPDSASAAIDGGDPEIITLYPECATDKNGVSRVFDGIPDLGAFEWVESTK